MSKTNMKATKVEKQKAELSDAQLDNAAGGNVRSFAQPARKEDDGPGPVLMVISNQDF